MSPVPGPPHPPPNGIPPPLLTPPPPQNLVFACYLHIYIHIYTYILPFPPLQPRISTLFAALESHDHPPTPPKPSICTLFAHIHTHIYSPFHPSNLASLRYLQHLRATTSSTDLVYLYISIITFFSNRL